MKSRRAWSWETWPGAGQGSKGLRGDAAQNGSGDRW